MEISSSPIKSPTVNLMYSDFADLHVMASSYKMKHLQDLRDALEKKGAITEENNHV